MLIMIHVRIGKESYKWNTLGRTLYVLDDLMLVNYKQYDTIVVNNAHVYPNLKVFANLCKVANVQLLVGGLLNLNTEALLYISDSFIKSNEL